MKNVNYVQVVRQTWEERFKMYMKCTKKELASMMAERDKYMSPDACKEFENNAKICPKCGEKMIFDEGVVYTSHPPMYGYRCPKCGNYEYDRTPYLGTNRL